MREHSIIMQPESVRGILDDWKTQTRRVINRLVGFGRITEFNASDTTGYCCDFRDKYFRWNSLTKEELLATCPYGVPGDRLWVKEGWRVHRDYDRFNSELICVAMGCDVFGCIDYKEKPRDDDFWGKWRSPLFMPRCASRIQLLIEDVRVEQLQDITEEDAINEGIEVVEVEDCHTTSLYFGERRWMYAKHAYRDVWNHINDQPKPAKTKGKITHYFSYPWEGIRETREHKGLPWHIYGNPFVWVLEFERCK